VVVYGPGIGVVEIGTVYDPSVGLYADELLMPVLFSLVIWAVLGAVDSAFFYDIIAWPFMIIFS
jgi:hypothetical protein